MDNTSQWYKIIERQVEKYRDNFTEKQYGKFKLDLILRIANKVDQLSEECGVCFEYKSQIAMMIGRLNSVEKMSKEDEKSYFQNIDELINHLNQVHGLGLGGEYKTVLMVIGIVIGAIFGMIILGGKGLFIGSAIGMAVGIAIGNELDDKAREEGKTI